MLVLEEVLYSKLAAGTALTALLGGTVIYNGLGGEAVAYPVVIFTKSSGLDDNDTPHRAKTLVYQITAISDKGKKEAEQIDNAIDALMYDADLGTMSGWYDYWCARESDISYNEMTAGGKVLWHEGALYRVRIATTS
jgi:hypothetical protein